MKLKMRKLRQAISRRITMTTTYRSSDVLAVEFALPLHGQQPCLPRPDSAGGEESYLTTVCSAGCVRPVATSEWTTETGLFAGFIFIKGFSIILISCLCCVCGSTLKAASPPMPSNCSSSSSRFSDVDEFFLEVLILSCGTPVGELFGDNTLRNPLLVALLRNSFLLFVVLELRVGTAMRLESAVGDSDRVALLVGILLVAACLYTIYDLQRIMLLLIALSVGVIITVKCALRVA
jgi:hypothetical protein